MNSEEIKEYLDFKSKQYNTTEFIKTDPIQIPHLFSKKEDIEIIGFLVATIAWGNRKSIINSANNIIKIMNYSPHEFIMNYKSKQLNFAHRTFNYIDLDFFFRSIQNIYLNHQGLEKSFSNESGFTGIKDKIINFRKIFLETQHEKRSEKHISNPQKKSTAKRINMFLRWMVRNDSNGVDFGIWKSIKPSELYIPLDIHTSKTARSIGLIKRKQNDWQALEELMQTLRSFDPVDPVKYDFALFGISAFENVII